MILIWGNLGARLRGDRVSRNHYGHVLEEALGQATRSLPSAELASTKALASKECPYTPEAEHPKIDSCRQIASLP